MKLVYQSRDRVLDLERVGKVKANFGYFEKPHLFVLQDTQDSITHNALGREVLMIWFLKK